MKHWCFLLFVNIFLLFSLDSDAQVMKPEERHDHPEVPRISAYEAKKLFDQGKLILANAEERKEFQRRHIAGSISISPADLHEGYHLPDKVIVAFYCP